MTRVRGMAILPCFLFFAQQPVYSQPVDTSPSAEASPLEGLSRVLPMISQIANEYRTDSDYKVEKIERGLGLDSLYLITIGRAEDCLSTSSTARCVYALVRDKADTIPFVTGCKPGQGDFYRQHMPNGDIASVFEFVCLDGSNLVVGISRSSISVNSELQR
jgi:hypothetical protein